MRIGNRLAAGKQPVGVLPITLKNGFVSFVGFVTNKKMNQTTNQQNISLTIKD